MITKKRLRYSLVFGAIGAVLLIAIFHIASLSVSSSTISSLQAQIEKVIADNKEVLNAKIKFRDFSKQDVDKFILNLESQIGKLETEIEILELQAQKAQLERNAGEYLSSLNLIEIKKKELKEYKLEEIFMGYAGLDYHGIVAVPKMKKSLRNFVKNVSNNFSPEVDEDGSMYVKAGQVIGGQGCTGVCTGTHLHFVVKEDKKAIDPCTVLPKRRFSIWGVKTVCGVDKSESRVIWPMPFTWIVTQDFGTLSPVINTRHNALDLIDREHAPVVATHDGWLTTKKKDCTGAVICNNGASNISIVCEQKDCQEGLRTEYWHLAWMIGE